MKKQVAVDLRIGGFFVFGAQPEVDSRRRGMPASSVTDQIVRIRIMLLDTEPEIWRMVEVPLEASLKTLHDIIQGAMGWLDYHLWEFEADDRRYGLPDPEWPDDGLSAAANVRLKTLAARGVRELLYTYDWATIGDTPSSSKPSSRGSRG